VAAAIRYKSLVLAVLAKDGKSPTEAVLYGSSTSYPLNFTCFFRKRERLGGYLYTSIYIIYLCN